MVPASRWLPHEGMPGHPGSSRIASERLQRNAIGQLVPKLKMPGHDGSTHLVMTPLEFMKLFRAGAKRLALSLPRTRCRQGVRHSPRMRSCCVHVAGVAAAGAGRGASSRPVLQRRSARSIGA